MKTTSLICLALTLMGTSWLLLVASVQTKPSIAGQGIGADFYIAVFDEDGLPLPNYLVTFDGRVIGKTNKDGLLAKSALTIGNVPTITLSLKSADYKYDKAHLTLLTLPPFSGQGKPVYSISSTLCLDFLECEDDIHNLKVGKFALEPSSLKVTANKKIVGKTYTFNIIRSPQHGAKISGVIRGLEKLIAADPHKSFGIPINLEFTYIDSMNHDLMLRVQGKRPNSAKAEYDFAFLLPIQNDLQATARDVHRFLAQTVPGGILGGKKLKLNFKEPLNDSYEVFAGGVASEIINQSAFNAVIPSTGRFFLTVVRKGEIVARKFFDAAAVDQIEVDLKQKNRSKN